MPIKISDLPAAGALGGTDIVPLVQSGVTKRTTLSAIASFVQSAITLVTRATNLAGGANGSVPYQSAADTTAMLAAGTAGQLLQTNGAGAPSWVTNLANGITATTQAAADNSTKVANTAYADRVSAKIQPITASVAANALTITLNPTVLDFRSATVGSGTVNSRSVAAAISVVVPDTATLGTASGVTLLHRLAVLAIDNAGTVELAVANISSGMWLDEAALISTAILNTSSDSAGVAYSTTARSSVPFRIVGFIDIGAATAGTWATAPTLIQGAGGDVNINQGGWYVTAALTGTAVDFTGIPPWVNEISIAFADAVVGTGSCIVQIGTAAALVTSGYAANTSVRAAATNTVLSANSTGGFILASNAGADTLRATMVLQRASGNTWLSTHFGISSGWMVGGGGTYTLSGPLGQLRLALTSGSWASGNASIIMR